MDQRLRDGQWKQRSVQASRPPESLGVLGAPIDGDYAQEHTEWTPLTRRSVVAAATPVPVSRRTGLIAGGAAVPGCRQTPARRLKS